MNFNKTLQELHADIDATLNRYGIEIDRLNSNEAIRTMEPELRVSTIKSVMSDSRWLRMAKEVLEETERLVAGAALEEK